MADYTKKRCAPSWIGPLSLLALASVACACTLPPKPKGKASSGSGQSMASLYGEAVAERRLDGEDYFQIQATGHKHKLIGIHNLRLRLEPVWPDTLRDQEEEGKADERLSLAHINAYGQVLAFHVTPDAQPVISALVLQAQEDARLLLIQAKLGASRDELRSQVLPLPSKIPVSTGERDRQGRFVDASPSVNFDFNTLTGGAQVLALPTAGDYPRLVGLLWYGLSPLLWEADFDSGQTPRSQFLIPRPAPGAYPLPLTAPIVRLYQTGSDVWLSLGVSAEHAPFLAGFVPRRLRAKARERQDKEHTSKAYLARYRRGLQLDWHAEPVESHNFILTRSPAALAAGEVQLISWRGHSLHTRTLSSSSRASVHKGCTASPSDLTHGIHITGALVSTGSVLWLSGESGLQQAATGSIGTGTQGFVLRWDLATCQLTSQLWGDRPERRYYGANFFTWDQRAYVLTYNAAPLTHDAKRSARLSLASLREP